MQIILKIKTRNPPKNENKKNKKKKLIIYHHHQLIKNYIKIENLNHLKKYDKLVKLPQINQIINKKIWNYKSLKANLKNYWDHKQQILYRISQSYPNNQTNKKNLN